MSNNYATIPTIKDKGFSDSSNLLLTAFVGGTRYGSCVQLTINGQYCALSQHEVLHLISALAQRLSHEITATGDEQYKPRPYID